MDTLKEPCIVMGIDPGSLRAGFGVVAIRDMHLSHVAHGTIVLDKKKDITDRLTDLAVDLTTLINKYQPTFAAVEDVFLWKNPRSAMVLGQARGAVLAALGLQGIKVHSLAATAIKSLVIGQGHADKMQIARMVARELNIQVPTSRDASDALAVALACAQRRRHLKEHA